jgi:ribulose-bisphosphate carboxylase large chain
MDWLRVTYRLSCDPDRAEERAEQIAREQTVEVPRSAVREGFVAEQILGRVEEVSDAGLEGVSATIAYPVAATGLDPAQFVNVLFGNSSLHSDVDCSDFEISPALRAAFGGPRFGLAGLRKTVGVYDRPLTCTAVKPMGLSPDELADLLRLFARAGIDVIKDDHGLADHAFCPFEARVRACLEAADRVADETGQRATYVPNLIGTPSHVFRQLELAQELGARAVMVSPMLIGLPTFWELCQERASLPVLAHPAFGGAQRIAAPALFGRLFRLYGADAVIYVNFGSRFSMDESECSLLAERLRAPWLGIEAALPVPAGGIEVENAAALAEFYGEDTMLLVGGSLQRDPDPERILERSCAFVEAVTHS